MEQKKTEQKTAQILYITIMLVLLIMALAVGLVTAANRRKAPAETTDASTSARDTARTSAVSELDHTSPSVTTERAAVKTAQSTMQTTGQPAVTTKATAPSSEKAAQAEVPKESLPEFIMPTIGDVAKKFSIDVLVFSNTMEDYRTHNGIDICAAMGEGVMAAADGIVTEVYEHPMMGNTVVIAHDGDSKSVYQNLADEITVSIGDTVKSGEIIGAVGDTAIIEIAEEPHLHFEIMVSGEYQNPLDYISVETMTVVYEE